MAHSTDSLAADFETLLRLAGLTVPEQQRTALLPAFVELREQVALLRGPRTAAAEPSNTFRLHPLQVG